MITRFSPLTILRALLSALVAMQQHTLFRPALACAALVAAWLTPDSFLAAPLLLGSLTEGAHTGDFILSESNGNLSRDNVTVIVPANTTYGPRTVLGKITASGKYVPYDDSFSDGREVAAGILYAEVANDTDAQVDKDGVVINLNAEVRADDLVWEEGVDEDGGLADLLALGIKARD